MAKAVTAETNTKTVKQDKQKMSKASKPSKPGIFARLAQYIRDVRSEMKRVVWPGRPEVMNSSLVVVVTLLFFVTFAFLVDSVVVEVLDLISKIQIG